MALMVTQAVLFDQLNSTTRNIRKMRVIEPRKQPIGGREINSKNHADQDASESQLECQNHLEVVKLPV